MEKELKNMNKPYYNKVSAYIHIPFCEHICYYCDFAKVFIEGQPVDEYIEYLAQEMRMMLEKRPVKTLETLYIGGGTPTSLSASQLDRLLSLTREILPFETGREFTVEANPGDLTKEKLDVLVKHGANRISLGVQTFDDKLLKKIGRKHTAKDVFQTIELLKSEGMHNISIDLIYALPGQSMESFRETLDIALGLDLPHYSLYSLILENKTLFMNWVRQGRIIIPNEDVQADMFDETIHRMNQNGLVQYEVSNFAKPGFESQHNLVYWNNDHYFGFGAGASGYLGDVRYRNHGPIQHYLKPLREEKFPVLEETHLSLNNQMEEQMFLGLRKMKGVSKAEFTERFGKSYEEVYGNISQKLVKNGLIKDENGFITLSEKGLFVGNKVFEEFLLD